MKLTEFEASSDSSKIWTLSSPLHISGLDICVVACFFLKFATTLSCIGGAISYRRSNCSRSVFKRSLAVILDDLGKLSSIIRNRCNLPYVIPLTLCCTDREFQPKNDPTVFRMPTQMERAPMPKLAAVDWDPKIAELEALKVPETVLNIMTGNTM